MLLGKGPDGMHRVPDVNTSVCTPFPLPPPSRGFLSPSPVPTEDLSLSCDFCLVCLPPRICVRNSSHSDALQMSLRPRGLPWPPVEGSPPCHPHGEDPAWPSASQLPGPVFTSPRTPSVAPEGRREVREPRQSWPRGCLRERNVCEIWIHLEKEGVPLKSPPRRPSLCISPLPLPRPPPYLLSPLLPPVWALLRPSTRETFPSVEMHMQT